MPNQNMIEGVVVVLEGKMATNLRQLAKQRSLAILEVEAAEQAFNHIRRNRCGLVVVQVGPDGREALKLIQLSAAASRHVSMIVAATHHSTELEREVLCAGARYYAAGTASNLVEPLVEAVSKSRKL